MNNVLVYFFLLISCWSFAIGSNYPVAMEDKEFEKSLQLPAPIVNGIVMGLTQEKVKDLEISYSIVTPFTESNINRISHADSSGRFEIHLDHGAGLQQIWLNVKGFFSAPIYAHQGFTIVIDTEKRKEKGSPTRGISFSGKDADLNQYLLKYFFYKEKEKQSLTKKTLNTLLDRSLSVMRKQSILDSVNQHLLSIEIKYSEENPSPYSQLLENERTSNYYGNMFMLDLKNEADSILFQKAQTHKPRVISNYSRRFYQGVHSYLGGKVSRGKRVDIKDYGNFSGFSVAEKNQYKSLVDSISLLEMMRNKNPDDSNRYNDVFVKAYQLAKDTIKLERATSLARTFDSLFAPPKADLLKLYFLRGDPDLDKKIQKNILKTCKTPWIRKKILANLQTEAQANEDRSIKIKAISEKVQSIKGESTYGEAVGKMASGAELYKVKHKELEQFLASIRNKNPDNAVLIHMWATWCMPCIKEFPHIAKLHQEIQSLPLTIVYLCTDQRSNIDKWKSKIAEYQLSGIHLFAKTDLVDQLRETFHLRESFPSDLFFTKDGELIPNAVRLGLASKGQLAQLISKNQE